MAVSGDLTQRAHIEQFLEARNFLDAIPFPKIVVAGNHDVPLYNVFARLFRMLDKFRRFISEDLEPFYVDNEIAVSGVNTARALTGKNGRINRQQLQRLRARFATVLPTHVKIVVTHHPFDLLCSPRAQIGLLPEKETEPGHGKILPVRERTRLARCVRLRSRTPLKARNLQSGQIRDRRRRKYRD